ncbi:MAG: serine/threonine-protein phosphatase [Candidatus Hydrogenedentes bacterium]|nr:serine/threonine-protein phosphatase [Candidatus Hydrogenedentota bacterium]
MNTAIHEMVCSEVWGGNGPANHVVRLPGLSGAIYAQPAGGKSGGDVYYMSTCRAALLARICLADVVGHGEQVAEVSGRLHQCLRQNMNRMNPTYVLAEMNQWAVARGLDSLATAACLSFHSTQGKLEFCYAGHPPALIFRRRESIWMKLALENSAAYKLQNMTLGVSSDAVYEPGECYLDPGDRLLLLSDGVTETPDAAHRLFGDERLLQLLNENKGCELGSLTEQIVQALKTFSGDSALDHDDITLILLEAGSRARGPKFWHYVKNNLRKAQLKRGAADATK